MMRRTAQLILFSASVVLLSPGAGAENLSPGNHTIRLTHKDRERSAIVHVPPSGASQGGLPLVVNFHGGGGHAANQQEYSTMDVLADRAGFLVIYPNGTGRLSTRLLTWNAGTCCGYAARENVDDVGFVRALLEKTATVAPIDRRRIYATGLSNGGMMAYRLAAEADVVAAIAPVAGGMVLAKIANQRAVPVMHIHSVDDSRALYSGGLGPPFPLTSSRVFHPNVEQMVGRWTAHNGCAADARIVDRRSDSNARGHTAVRIAFEKCRDGADVVLWKLTGAGHVWPGGKPKYLERLLGPSTDIIDANAEMWSFFERFSLASYR